MAAVFSFGSLGDILAIAELAYKLARALSESTGSSAEYQAVIAELDTLTTALRILNEIIARQPLQPSVQHTIRHALERCRSLMDAFKLRIEGYQRSLMKGGSGNRWRDSWRKIGWSIFRKEELIALKQELSEQKATINMMLSMSHCTALERVEQTTRFEVKRRLEEDFMAFQAKSLEEARKQHEQTLDVVRMSSQEQVPFNLQGYMDEFSKSMATEVRMLLNEVGQLREERQDLQHKVTNLKKQLGLNANDPSTGDNLELDEADVSRWNISSRPPADAPFDSPRRPPPYGSYLNSPRDNLNFDQKPATAPLNPVVVDWANWTPNPDFLPSPPPEGPILLPMGTPPSPGLFGPRD